MTTNTVTGILKMMYFSRLLCWFTFSYLFWTRDGPRFI